MQQSERVLVSIYQTARPLLCNDHEIGGHTRAVSGQRLGNYVPAATETKATMVQQQRNGVFVIRAAVVATQRRGKHSPAAMIPDTTLEELCSLCDPCRNVISNGQG
jgi:hypothetical protein